MDIVNSILEGQKTDSCKSTEVHKDVDLDIDEGTLLASDYNTLDLKAYKSNGETYVKALTRDNVQLLINKIWALPIERNDEAVLAKLPKPQFVLPRSRVIPKPKPLTKWQRFAKEKGIIKKKKGKSKLKWDDELQKWIPTYGYKRSKEMEQKEWLVEVNENNEKIEDPFTAAKEAKHERQSKNELQRLRNIAKAKNVKLPRTGFPTTEQFSKSRQLAEAVTVARMSTASVGKFQERLPKEKDAKGIAKEVPGIKKDQKKVITDLKEEKKQNRELANNVFKKRKILSDAVSLTPTNVTKPKAKSKRLNKKKVIGSKKPKGGAGGRDMRLKFGGRKRR